jgi:predicted nucleotidyltransferase
MLDFWHPFNPIFPDFFGSWVLSPGISFLICDQFLSSESQSRLMLEDLRREHARLLEESVQKIVAVLSGRVEKISLFGSYARGRSDIFTDLDILIVMNSEKSFVDRLNEIYSLLALPVDADILCYTPEEVERLKNKGFLKKILAEEVVLYEKGGN